MESHGTDRTEDRASAETPEDVAVLYSWANLHGAKYRDFSASRREYRAQLRRRAAEQVREQALLAQAEAEAAAKTAETAARQAAEVVRNRKADVTDSSARRTQREVEEAERTAVAERLEAARRAEVAAMAEAAARREEREIAEAQASAQRQAARYADSEIRRRAMMDPQAPAPVPGQISDPYTPFPAQAPLPQSLPSQAPLPPPLVPLWAEHDQRPSAPVDASASRNGAERKITPAIVLGPAPIQHEYSATVSRGPQRRPQGYSPDHASGVRQIYRGPDHDASHSAEVVAEPLRDRASGRTRPMATPVLSIVPSQDVKTLSEPTVSPNSSSQTSDVQQPVLGGKRHTDPQPQPQPQVRTGPTASRCFSGADGAPQFRRYGRAR